MYCNIGIIIVSILPHVDDDRKMNKLKDPLTEKSVHVTGQQHTKN